MLRNLVIFDGSNFYHKAKCVFPAKHLSNFDYIKLVRKITESEHNFVEYCVGEIRRNPFDQLSERLYKNQQALFYNLERQGIVIKKGFMLKTDGVYHEKGVDVRIAVDIIKGALKDEYDACYVITSDTDIIPAIKEARGAGKQTVYVGFEGTPSRAMRANCSKAIIVSRMMLDGCYARP